MLPTGITGTATIIKSTGGVNICAALVSTYIAALPFDPTSVGAHYTSCADYDTGYTVATSESNRVTVAAPTVENGESISITR